MKSRLFCAFVFILFSPLHLSASSDPLLGCPDKILGLVKQMRGHGKLHAAMDWDRFSKERPEALTQWLVTFEWFEMASAEAMEVLRIGLSKGQSLEEIIQAVQSLCPSPIPESVVHIFRLLRRDFKPMWPEEHPNMQDFLLELKQEEMISLLHFAYSDEFLGARNIRERIAIASQYRDPKTQKWFFKSAATDSSNSGLRFGDFFATLASTFRDELKGNVLSLKKFEDDWQSFSQRHHLNSGTHPKATAIIYKFFRLFLALYPLSEQGIELEKILASVQYRIDNELSQIYLDESRRQAKNPLPTPIKAEPVRIPQTLVLIPENKQVAVPQISHRRHKQQAALAETTVVVKTPHGPMVAPAPVFKKPEDLPLNRFLNAEERETFLHWLKHEASDVKSQILRRIESMESQNALTLTSQGMVLPTIRDPRVWRIKTRTKARVAVHYHGPGKYWVLSWDAQAKANEHRADRLIDIASEKLAHLSY